MRQICNAGLPLHVSRNVCYQLVYLVDLERPQLQPVVASRRHS